jgi:DNA-binding NtrC family response regulator
MSRAENDPVSLLIIDDNIGSLELLSSALKQHDLHIYTADDPERGLDLVYQHRPHVVLTDLVMPGLSGLEVLDRIMQFDPGIDVLLMTAHYSTESAVDAIRRGASDYLNKPIDLQVLRTRVNALVEQVRQRHRALRLESELLDTSRLDGIIGNSPAMWDLFSKIRRIAPHFRTVLVTGPTGTGKDLVARTLYRLSPVFKGNFVVLNCSAVVETLFESELFGHVRGAFTGAASDKMGLFEYANEGVLFLDEIGDMPMNTQAKLLRALQNQEIQRVGSLTPRKVNVRVIAATHQDLRSAIADKKFREDLYYRLTMVEIAVPPLVERNGDLPLLVRHFVAHFAKQYGKRISGLTPRAEIALGRHDWPGNVRELENVIGHACMMTAGDRVDVPDLPDYFRASASGALSPAAPLAGHPRFSPLDEQEFRLVSEALAASRGNQSEAARILKIGRDALRYKMKKFGLEPSLAQQPSH